MTNRLSRLLLVFTLFVATTLTSCEDEAANQAKYYSDVDFLKTGLFFDGYGQTQSTTFKLDNVAYLEIDECPEGWEVVLDFYKGLVTVTSPQSEDDITYDSDGVQENKITEITFTGETHGGYGSVYATLVVGIVDFVNIYEMGQQANSMVAIGPETFFIFNPTFKGEDESETISGIAGCKMLWRSYPSSIRHAQMLSPTEFGFYITPDEYDMDEDDDVTDIWPGNAVIAAVDSSGDVLWSWHIWSTENEIQEVSFNGKTFMDRNLGAEKNSIESDSTILYSTGLYYQWGRKDPFIQPLGYNATGGYDGFMVDGDGDAVEIEYEESTSSIGKLSYSIEEPLIYVMGVSDSDRDWLYKNHDADLWSDDKKSIYDPSPKGWRIPRSSDFDGVTIAYVPESLPKDADATYGAYLADKYSNTELFMGVGRRTYLAGKVANINSEYKPWMGYYWTSSSTVETRSKCFVFDNLGMIDSEYAARRANGMQIRCVKDE